MDSDISRVVPSPIRGHAHQATPKKTNKTLCQCMNPFDYRQFLANNVSRTQCLARNTFRRVSCSRWNVTPLQVLIITGLRARFPICKTQGCTRGGRRLQSRSLLPLVRSPRCMLVVGRVAISLFSSPRRGHGFRSTSPPIRPEFLPGETPMRTVFLS